MPLEVIRAKDTETYLDFFHGVKRRLEAGVAKECMGTYSLSKGGNQRMTEIEVAYMLSAPFSAGVDTVCWFRIAAPLIDQLVLQTLSTIRWCLGGLCSGLLRFQYLIGS